MIFGPAIGGLLNQVFIVTKFYWLNSLVSNFRSEAITWMQDFVCLSLSWDHFFYAVQ